VNIKKFFLICFFLSVSFLAQAVVLSEATVGRLTDQQFLKSVKVWVGRNMLFDFIPKDFVETVRERLYKVEKKHIVDDLIRKMILSEASSDADKVKLLAQLEKLRKEKKELSEQVTALQLRLKGMGIPGASVAEIVTKLKEGNANEIEAAFKAAGLSEDQIEKIAEDLKIKIIPEAFQEELKVLADKGVALEAVKMAAAGQGDLTLEEIERKLKESGRFDDDDIQNFMAVLRGEQDQEDDDDDDGPPPPPGMDDDEDMPPPPPGLEIKVDEKIKRAEQKATEFDSVESFTIFRQLYNNIKNKPEILKKQILKSFEDQDELIAALFEIFGLGEYEIEQAIKVLTPIMKKASDALFLQKLREAILNFPGPGKYDQYLRDIKNYLKDNLRKKRDFKRKENFDDLFETTSKEDLEIIKKWKNGNDLDAEDKKGLFGAIARSLIKDKVQTVGLEKFLDIAREDLSDSKNSKILKSFRDSLSVMLFDDEQIAEVEDQIFSLVVNLLVALRPDIKPFYDLDSDAVAIELFENLRELKPPFNLPGHIAVEDLMSVLEDFKDDKRFFVSVTTGQIEKLEKAFEKFQKEKDVARWSNEINNLREAFKILAEEIRFKQDLIGAVQGYREKFDKFKSGQDFKSIKDQADLAGLAKGFNVIVKLIEKSASQPFFKPVWEQQFKKVEQVFRPNFKQTTDGKYKTLKKVKSLVGVLEAYKKELDSWDPQEISALDKLRTFYNKVLRERFAVLAREIDLLRINPKFKRYWALLSKDAEQKFTKEKMLKTGKKPFVRLLRDYEVDTPQGLNEFSKDFILNNFLTAIAFQILTQPTVGWKELKDEKSGRFKRTIGNFLEDVLDAFRKFKMAEKKEFDKADALESLAFVDKLSQLKAALRRLKKQKVDQDLLVKVLQGIDEGQDPKTVVANIKKLIQIKSTDKLDKETEIVTMLTKKQKESQASALILKALQKWVGVGQKKFKLEPSGAKLRDLLVNNAKLPEVEVDKVMKDPFRTAETVKEYLQKKLGAGVTLARLSQQKKLGRFKVSNLFEMIEPYGLLLESLQQIPVVKKTNKMRKELLDEILVAFNTGRFAPGLDEFSPTSGKRGLIESGIYKGKLKGLIEAFKALDLNSFEDKLKSLVGDADLGLESSDEYVEIVSATLEYLQEISIASIVVQLNELNKGVGFLENDPDKNIIPGVLLKSPEGKKKQSAAQIRLNDKMIKLLKGKLAGLLEATNNLVAKKPVDKTKPAADIKVILDTFKKAANELNISDLKLKNPKDQKKAVEEKIEAYFNSLQKKMEGIIVSLFPEKKEG